VSRGRPTASGEARTSSQPFTTSMGGSASAATPPAGYWAGDVVNVELYRRSIQALNRRDLDAVLTLMEADVGHGDVSLMPTMTSPAFVPAPPVANSRTWKASLDPAGTASVPVLVQLDSAGPAIAHR
jgi:hypothetical protein